MQASEELFHDSSNKLLVEQNKRPTNKSASYFVYILSVKDSVNDVYQDICKEDEQHCM